MPNIGIQQTELTGSSPADSQSSAAVPWMVFNGTNYDRVRTARNQGDGWSGVGIPGSVPYLTNGNSYDRQYGNTQGTLLASAARTASVVSPTQTNYNAKGVVVYLNITLASGTGGLQVMIRSIDPISGAAVNHNIAPTAITATGLYAYELYPGISGSETGSLKVQQRTSGALPRTFYVAVIHGDATGYTYSVGYALDL